MDKPKTEHPAVPAAPMSQATVDTFKTVTGSRHIPWGRHLLDRTDGVMKHKPGKGVDAKADRAATADVTMASLQAFEPKDPVEGMIAAQAIALHEASMECFRLAMIPQQSFEVATKCRKDGANLARAMTDMVDALARHRGKGPQVIRVEKMLVADGGQAVVGNVTAQASQALPPAPAAAPLALEQGASLTSMAGAAPAPVERGRG